ncbi:AAA ATPase central domain protein [Chloroherpeton thalassium ATCC 35110]|uniref:AAA ATPase central domain protein n=1 Tax=Chloroherpeton thalassium (strain ATCC 35110 / GB-78) TaxID=517418 RepID=B3QSL5_CHLT3|nr:ATP-binding protein [Chloroherpeton thalassium]ACF14062.1 AAA ATPase central domain protein [Chloroherpeton thalassium ATCC 35110]
MSLLGSKKKCPFHGIELEIAHRGKKSIPDFPLIEVLGLPMLYCPKCFDEGKDTSLEVEAGATNKFLRDLRKLLEKADFPGQLSKPKITVNFNPFKTALEESGQSGKILEANGKHVWRRGPKENEDDSEDTRLENFETRNPKHSFDQLILEPETMSRLREAVNVLVSQELIYDSWNLKSVARTGRRVALNFYGPPGTGKTLAADAIANYLGKEILIVSYAELESKYVGETPKNIRAAFQKAAKTGAVLFFDEADSVLGKRLTNISQSADNSINVARSTTLIELDNFDGIVIFASNLVGNYDTAFLRRMLAHIEFHLPSTDQRVAIWKCHIPPEMPTEENLDFQKLADDSAGAAGGDIQNAILLAASYATMRQKSEQVVKTEDLSRAIEFLLQGKHKIIGHHTV